MHANTTRKRASIWKELANPSLKMYINGWSLSELLFNRTPVTITAMTVYNYKKSFWQLCTVLVTK